MEGFAFCGHKKHLDLERQIMKTNLKKSIMEFQTLEL